MVGVVVKVGLKVLGKVVIGVGVVFLVIDVIELGCMMNDLIKKKGADVVKFLRVKVEEFDDICFVF